MTGQTKHHRLLPEGEPGGGASCTHCCNKRGKALRAAAAVLGMLLSMECFAASLPGGFTEFVAASGLSSPTAMEFAPDGRLFVCQQNGQLRVVRNMSLLPHPFLTVQTDTGGERGLLGVAFDPAFSANNFLYVYYTATSPTVHNRVSRFTANGDSAVAGSEVPILELETLSAGNHNGGAIHFGPDGKLYVAAGDNAVGANSQNLNNRLGKMLRINTDGSIPADNPFYNATSGANRAIWALGLRNPFTFAIQPGTGRIFINDVGEGTWEEVNEGVRGANYGWPNCEGSCGSGSFHNPVFQFSHGGGSISGCSIVGGAFYNALAPQFPRQYSGSYFFADLCGGWIRRLDTANGNGVSDFASGIESPVDIKVGAEGRLYYLSRGSGEVRAIDYSGGAPALGVARQGNNVTILWPAPSSGYVLQSAATLGPGANWNAVPDVTTENGRHTFIVNSAGTTRYYRLMRQ